MAEAVRVHYQEELDALEASALGGLDLVSTALGRTMEAVEHQDVEMAQLVIADDDRIDGRYLEVHQALITLLATQSPVATDLRMVVTAMRMSADLERMGDLARHVAKVARLRYPESAVPADVRATILQMGQVAERIVAKAGSVIAAKDVEDAKTLERDDDAMDELHRELFGHLIDGSWQHGTEAAVDMTLVGRYYERFADHAVSVAHRVVYLVTGEWDVAEDHEEQEDRDREVR